MPRNVEAEVAGVSSLFLYDIDAVQNVIEAHQAVRAKEAEKAEAMVSDCAEWIWRKWLEGANLQHPRLHVANATA